MGVSKMEDGKWKPRMEQQTRQNRRHGRENRLDGTHAADDVVVPQPELAVRQSAELVGEILLVEAALEVDQPVLALHAGQTPGKPWLDIWVWLRKGQDGSTGS